MLFATTLAMGLTSFLLNEWAVGGNTHLGLLESCTESNCTSIHTFNCSSNTASDSCRQGQCMIDYESTVLHSHFITTMDVMYVHAHMLERLLPPPQLKVSQIGASGNMYICMCTHVANYAQYPFSPAAVCVYGASCNI